MKKMLALLLVITMLFSVAVVSASAQSVNITDEFLRAVQYEYDNYSITKDDIDVIYMLSFDKNRYIVKYDVNGYMYTDDMFEVGLKNYILTSSRPEPELFYHGKLYNLEYAYDNYMLSDRDLQTMYEFKPLNMEKTKIHLELLHAMGSHTDDEYINVRFEVVGSEKGIGDRKLG